MPNEHAPFTVRDDALVAWKENLLNLASVPVQYGYGCLDGMVNTLRTVGGDVFLSAVDAGAHFARHIYNSARSVLYKSPAETGTLEQAVRAGRSYDMDYPLSLETRAGPLGFKAYYGLYLKLMRENFAEGFVHGNYVRPFYAACDDRVDGTRSDFAINGRVYQKTFSMMMQHWPGILSPRHPDFPGLNILVCRESRCPAPGTSLIGFKSSSTYAPTRGPAVEEKNRFNDRFGQILTAHDILLYDHTMQAFREASGSNLFVVSRDGTVYTPALDGSIFPGLTRDFVVRLIGSDAGAALGLRLREDDLGEGWLPHLSRDGGEVFFTGSALGVIPARRLILPRTKDPRDITDYDIHEFSAGVGTFASVISDCYRCFSIGDAFEVSYGRGKKALVRDFEEASLLFEVPRHLRDQASERFMKLDGTRPLDMPADQCLRSGRVAAVPPRNRRVAW
ncbi:MAG: aminotransferase class IV [Candidatus Micrarchaeia archaeon]